MNNTSNFPANQIRTNLDYATTGTKVLKPLTLVAKKLFESSEKVAAIALVALTLSLVMIACVNFGEFGTATYQYCNAIGKITFVP